MKKLSEMTAAELEQSKDVLKDYAEKKRKRKELTAQLRIMEEPMLADLREVGWDVNSVWDLGNRGGKYTEALPVLLKHLLLPYHHITREGIARHLAHREARFAWQILVAEYLKAPEGVGPEGFPNHEKDALGIALSETVSAETMDELIALARDRSNGTSRIFFIRPFRRSKSLSAKQALEDLATDPDLAKEIAAWKPKKSRTKPGELPKDSG